MTHRLFFGDRTIININKHLAETKAKQLLELKELYPTIFQAIENIIIKEFLEEKLVFFGDNNYYNGAKWVKLWLEQLEEDD